MKINAPAIADLPGSRQPSAAACIQGAFGATCDFYSFDIEH